MLIATNAIILKRIPYSDTSVICRAFTENWGKVTILAKGALRPKNIIGALLEPVNHVHIHVIPRYKGDVTNPEGGVRGVIPNKQKYT